MEADQAETRPHLTYPSPLTMAQGDALEPLRGDPVA
jgi:hypothetical protein